ncbi:uncharacterized protein LOC122945122 isoform X2 [Bufo gargarizans]|uniref:uncharacterized protein LOC122945122 isoform X2 n=1 Tax=Bufo gargarizans TaxID=30331 RepID=UPI001CF5EF72|nr:uncharacterized protein LOC122945122 isoform X2 [Bufo gargarizans]
MEPDAPSLPPAKEAQKKVTKPPHCISCAKRLPDEYGKKLCKECISDVIQQEQSSLMDSIRSVVQEELGAVELLHLIPKTSPLANVRVLRSLPPQDLMTLMIRLLLPCNGKMISLSEGEIYESNRKFYFSSEEMGDLLKAVRAKMGIEEAPRSLSIQDEMFGGLRVKKSKVFPMNENIKR